MSFPAWWNVLPPFRISCVLRSLPPRWNIDGHIDWFNILATVTSAAMNVDIYLCGGLTRWPKSGRGSYSPTFSCFSGNLHADDLNHGSHLQWIHGSSSTTSPLPLPIISFLCCFLDGHCSDWSEMESQSCFYTLYVCNSAHSDNLQELVLSFHHVSSRDWILVGCLASKHLFPPGHPTSSQRIFISISLVAKDWTPRPPQYLLALCILLRTDCWVH